MKDIRYKRIVLFNFIVHGDACVGVSLYTGGTLTVRGREINKYDGGRFSLPVLINRSRLFKFPWKMS